MRESRAIVPLTVRQARHMLDQAGYPDQALPRMGSLVPLDKDMNSWIENCSGRLELVLWEHLAKPAWVGRRVPTHKIGKYLRERRQP